MTKSLLPRSALDHHMAVLGKTGSGKTSVVKAAIVEPALEADERVCVIDPTGAWWGLRLKADGRTKGYPVYVFGGRHADYPLLGTHGEAMADVIGTTNTPAILDTSLMKTGERMKFFTDFADALLRKNEGPLRLVIDEAHIFMPQAGTRGSGAMPEMLHAGNNLISLGRSRGLRIVLLSQRAAKLHKDSLTQVETLLALRLIAPQDRGAVREWIADQADLEKGKEIIASLPKLAAGEAWAWSPEADFLKRLQFPPPATYDSSAAPTSSGKSKRLSPIDLDKLKDRLAKVDAVAKDNDPKLLRAEVARLKAENTKLQSTAASPAASAKPDKDAIAAAEKKGFERATNDAVRNAKAQLADAVTAIEADANQMTTSVKGAIDVFRMATADRLKSHLRDKEALKPVYSPPTPVPRAVPAVAPLSPARANLATPNAISAPSRVTDPADRDASIEQKILDALAELAALGVKEPARELVALMARYSLHTNKVKSAIVALKNAGSIEYGQGTLMLTPAGAEIASAAAAPSDAAEMRARIIAILGEPTDKLLDHLSAIYPEDCTREELATACGYSIHTNKVKSAIVKLKDMGFMTYPAQGRVRADQSLFF